MTHICSNSHPVLDPYFIFHAVLRGFGKGTLGRRREHNTHGNLSPLRCWPGLGEGAEEEHTNGSYENGPLGLANCTTLARSLPPT